MAFTTEQGEQKCSLLIIVPLLLLYSLRGVRQVEVYLGKEDDEV